MALAWRDVISKPEYQALNSDQKAQAQADYFQDVVAPRVPPEELSSARSEFYSKYEPPNVDPKQSLGGTLQFGPFDTGIKIPEKLEAGLIGAGDGMLSTYRGVKQILGVDEESEKENQRHLNRLYKDGDLKTSAIAGNVVGNILEPATLALPVAKAKTILGMTASGAAGGTIAGGLNYVDEEAGASRLGNAALGAGFGAIGGAALGGGVNLYRKAAGKETIPLRANYTDEQLKAAGVIDSPVKSGEAKTIKHQSDPDIEAGRVAFKEMGLSEQVGKSEKIPGQGGFIDFDVFKEGKKRINDLYDNYVYKPAWEAAKRNPAETGASISGAVYGAWGAPGEDAAPHERAGYALAGALIGLGGVRGFKKIAPGVSERLEKSIIDDAGLPDWYSALKKERGMSANHALAPFADLLDDVKRLTPKERNLMHNILQGEAPQTKDLAFLTEKARENITNLGQKMVDIGLLPEDIFKKNAASYLHRDYLSHLTKHQQSLFSNKIKMIGSELRPRGYVVSANPDEVPGLLSKGGKVIGEPHGGKQKVRMQLTKEQRQALGEIEDAAFSIARTGSLMANDYSTYKLYDDVAKYVDDLSKKSDTSSWITISEGKITGTQINKFGNLEGKKVPPEIYDDLKSIDFTKRWLTESKYATPIKMYMDLNRMWKVSKTALNPVVHVNNIVSNSILYDLADGSATSFASAVNAIRKKNDLYNQAKNLGVFDSDFVSNELRKVGSSVLDEYTSLARISTDPITAAVDTVHGLWKKTGGKMIGLYQSEDNIFRLALFADRVKRGESPEQAAAYAKKWMIDYQINAPIINFMRNTTHPFLAYTYRVVPLLAESAIKHPLKFAKWAAVGYALNHIGEKYGGGDTEKERRLMTEKEQGRIFGIGALPPQMVKMPFQVGGTPQYLDVTRWVPGGDVFENQKHGFLPNAPAPLQPSFGAAGSIYKAGAGYDDFTGKKLPGLGVSAFEDAKIKGEYLVKQFVPNFPGVPGAYSTQKIMDAVRGKPNQVSDVLPVWQATIQSLGIKLKPADVEKMALRSTLETKRQVRAIRDRLIQDNLELQKGRITQEEYMRSYREANDQMAEITRKYNKKMGGQ